MDLANQRRPEGGRTLRRSDRQTGPGFFTTMQIPILQGGEIENRDRQRASPVAVVSDLFARTYFGEENPIGRHITVSGSSPTDPTGH